MWYLLFGTSNLLNISDSTKSFPYPELVLVILFTEKYKKSALEFNHLVSK